MIFQQSKIQPEELEQELRAKNYEITNYDEVKIKLDRLTGQREQMGPVNLRAKIEEDLINKTIEDYELERLDNTYWHSTVEVGMEITLNAFKALNEDYEEYETEFFKKLHEKNILDGSRKWWEFNKVLSSNVTTESSTAGTPTHSTIGVFGRERSSEEMEEFWNNLTFEDRMMIKNGLASREMLGRYQLKLLMFK